MKFIIVALGSKGDNHPLLAMAKVLQKNGHEAILMSTGNYDFPQIAAENNIPFHKILDDQLCDDLLKHEVEGKTKVFYRLFKEFYLDYAAPNIIEAIKQLSTLNDTIIITGPAGIMGAYLAGELLNLPVIVAHLAPLSINSFSSPARFDSFDVMNKISIFCRRLHLSNHWATLLRKGLHRAVLVPFFEKPYLIKPLNDYRKRLGLPKIKSHLGRQWLSQADLSLGLFPKWFYQKLNAWGDQEPPEDLPKNTYFLGFPNFDEWTEEYELPIDVKTFLQLNHPIKPIIATFGTGNLHQKKIFTELSEACQRLNYPAIFLGIHENNRPDNLSANILFIHYLPFRAILPYASLCIHHGGVGTTAQCFEAGLPQIIRPSLGDQFDNSARVQKLGCGIEIPIKEFNAINLTKSIKTATSQIYYISAKNIQEKMNNQISFEEQVSELFSEKIQKLLQR